MNPGTGYIFKASSASTFSFPVNNASTSVKVKSLLNTNSTSTKWSPEVGQRYVMPVLAQVYKNGALYQPAGLQLGIFKDGICYGSGSVSNNRINLTVGSDVETLSGLNCKVYDPKTSTEYTVEESVNFESLNTVGNVSAPAAFHIKAVSTEMNQVNEPFSVYPSQIHSSFNVTISSNATSTASVVMYDMQGKFVKSLFDGELNGNKTISVQRENLNNGLYMIKATVGDKQFTQKVVLQ